MIGFSHSCDPFHNTPTSQDISQTIIGQRYTIGELLGKGATSCVFYGQRDSLDVAIKCIYKNCHSITNWKKDRDLGTTVPMEIFLLKRLNHPGIIKYVDFAEDKDYFYLVMELFGSTVGFSGNDEAPPLLCESPVSDRSAGGLFDRRPSADLFDYIDTNPLSTERSIRHIFGQLAQTVFYLHQNNIVHRDIKDENVVIDQNMSVKLIDFGAADRIPSCPADYFTTFRGTKKYIAPELLDNTRHRGPEVDVYCLGILLYTLSYGGPPFHNLDDIRNQRYTPTSIVRSTDLNDLLMKMLHPKPAQRATMEQVCKHPWLAL